MSVLWWRKYQQTESTSDLQRAVHHSRTATDAMGPGEHIHVAINLSSYLVEYYKVSTDHEMATIDEAIQIMEAARNTLPNNSQHLAMVTGNLTIALLEKVLRCAGLDDVDKGIARMREILSSVQTGQNGREGMLTKLGTMLAHRYNMVSAIPDLEEAVNLGYEAVQEAPDGSGNPTTLVNLSNILYIHHKRTGLSRTLEEALRVSQLRLDKLADHPFDKAAALLNHGIYLHHKSQRYRLRSTPESLDILDDAINCGRQALETLPPGNHYRRADILGMTGVWYTTKMQMTKMLECGAKGVNYLKDALELLGNESRSAVIARSHRNLAHIHDVYFRILKAAKRSEEALEHLNHAIDHCRIAVHSTPEEDPEHGTQLKNLASLLLQMCWGQDPSSKEGTDDEDTFQSSLSLFVDAANDAKALPLVRISSSIQAALLFWRDDRSEEAHILLQDSIALLSQIHSMEMSSEDLQEALREVSGLAGLATTTALATGRPVLEALRALEAAHCIISGLFMSSKSDIPELRAVNPGLASKYDRLRSELAYLSRDQGKRGDFFKSRNLQQSLLDELSQTESEIKQLPGFEDFMETLSEDDFKTLASDGPVIAINVSRVRSDAIIVTSRTIRALCLPRLNYNDLERKLGLFGTMGNEARRDFVVGRRSREQGDITTAMRWLWEVAVEPVLDDVMSELTTTRRIWWIQTGLAGHAPLHAAGDHAEGSTANTMNRVISTYISSFKALKYARERQRMAPIVPQHNMLLVTMSRNPPPHMDLDTSYEENVARELFGNELTHLSQPEPSTVLDRIPTHSFVHFACHGFSSLNDPSSNGLLLIKCGEAATLTISDFEGVENREGAVAYLSACSTAGQSDLKLMDEAIHLANSFQTAGFQHVIGTLWGADDEAAGEVAREFYSRLTLATNENEQRSGLEVARALHNALIQVKHKRRDQNHVVSWGPFIHIGT